MDSEYARASKVMQEHRQEILGISGVHGIAVSRETQFGGPDRPCVVVYVDSSVDREAIPREIGGFKVFTAP